MLGISLLEHYAVLRFLTFPPHAPPTLPLPSNPLLRRYDTYPPGKHQLAVHPTSPEARRLQTQARLWELSEKLVQA
jgi:hypothetical protein